ncbi:uncharacterized protein B0J16DRAFT_346283 [Fusarium flagelliforme]|uniref:uncharacterized protein n=1 Tax=Fusarium flagelliforme TaxID=2675880 RepID=UPI001E8EC9CC|nr:uncharacterized protein B0J16DRAFT_346283 [Fusarium flagelliforme]KAH7179109.1 hypothetical protein B0J16DRAFT_346283 [Fusarium flagelliforme]
MHPTIPLNSRSPSPIFDSTSNPSSTSSMEDFGDNNTPQPPENPETDLIFFGPEDVGDNDVPAPPAPPEEDLIIFGPEDFGDNDTPHPPQKPEPDLIFFGPVEEGISNLTIAPSPSPEPKEGTFIKFVQKGISDLASAAGLTKSEKQSLDHAISVCMEGWGHEEIPETPKWQTQLGRNNSPFEYSVSFGLKTGKKQVRFAFELPAENTIQAMQESALKLNENIGDTDLDVLLWGFGMIRYIFFLPNPIGKFTAWYGYDDPIWKIYLDPQAQGQDNAGRLISQALHHLDMTKAWHVIDDTMQFGSGLPIRLGIDLVDEKVARVEVIVDFWGHPTKNFAYFATERYYPRNNEIVTEAEVVRLCKILLGVEDEDAVLNGEPPLVSYSFTRTENRDVELEMTLHIPVWPYMHDDAQFQKRVEEWMRGLSHVLSGKQIDNLVEGYRDCLKAVARRPLEDGSGLHSWFSLKDSKKHGDSITVHFSTEMYGALLETGDAQ